MRQGPTSITEGLTSKSAKIRALAEAGYERREIATFLAVRYQHVRNVLVQAGFSGGLAGDRSVSTITRPRPAKDAVAKVNWSGQQLADAGFVRLGHWTATEEGAFELSARAPTAPGVYAFLVDDVVRYVGLTRRGLRVRLGHYVYGHARQRTSARVKELILDALASGATVEVLIATPPALIWNGLPIDTAAGLESGLISLICPCWNIQGVGS